MLGYNQTMKIPFFIPSIGQEERRAVDRVLEKVWLTMGEVTLEFEEEFAKYINAPYCIAVSSCTAAMFLTIQALKKFNEGIDKVSLPSFCFSATAAVLKQSNVDFKFEDIELSTFLMKKTTNLSIPMHYGGLLNEQPNVLFEDSAHRIVENSFIGNITCFSFYAIKNMTTGEGGMIALKYKEMADWLRKARLHGISSDAWKRYQKDSSGIYQVEFPGWKYNMTDMQSAMGLVQLKKLDFMNEKRRKLVNRYNDRLEQSLDREANHLYPILVNNRTECMSYFKDLDIGFSYHFPPLHLQPAYKDKNKTLPVTEFVGARVITLPLYPDMTFEQVDYVASHVRLWWERYGKPEFENQ